MIEQFNENLRLEFGVLMKEGKEAVWNLIEEAEELGRGIDTQNEYDAFVGKLLVNIREEKKLYFDEYKQVIRFVKEHRRLNGLKPKSENDYIVL